MVGSADQSFLTRYFVLGPLYFDFLRQKRVVKENENNGYTSKH